MKGIRKAWLRTLLGFVRNFAVFFIIISFVITCSFLLFFSSVSLSEADIRAFAPIVFFNVFILAAFFVVLDTLRRKFTIDRSAKEIHMVLSRLMDGDFTARVRVDYVTGRYNGFAKVGEDINRMAEELASVETLRSDFIANVSHELKTPLAVMRNYATILQKSGISEEERLLHAKVIADTAQRLASLITNILRLNKLENQQIFPTAQPYNVSEQLCECLLQFEESWEQKDIEIETDIEEDVLLTSDAELLSLVWSNLISNALKFTDEGGTVSISLKREPQGILVTVRDTGCGMTPQVGKHIFEKFYQGDSSHAGVGNGLGLALVKRVVDILHGEIRVESTYGQGSCFSVFVRSDENA